VTSSPRTPFWRMLPSVIGPIGSSERGIGGHSIPDRDGPEPAWNGGCSASSVCRGFWHGPGRQVGPGSYMPRIIGFSVFCSRIFAHVGPVAGRFLRPARRRVAVSFAGSLPPAAAPSPMAAAEAAAAPSPMAAAEAAAAPSPMTAAEATAAPSPMAPPLDRHDVISRRRKVADNCAANRCG
jgi:hypothetical protein